MLLGAGGQKTASTDLQSYVSIITCRLQITGALGRRVSGWNCITVMTPEVISCLFIIQPRYAAFSSESITRAVLLRHATSPPQSGLQLTLLDISVFLQAISTHSLQLSSCIPAHSGQRLRTRNLRMAADTTVILTTGVQYTKNPAHLQHLSTAKRMVWCYYFCQSLLQKQNATRAALHRMAAGQQEVTEYINTTAPTCARASTSQNEISQTKAHVLVQYVLPCVINKNPLELLPEK